MTSHLVGEASVHTIIEMPTSMHILVLLLTCWPSTAAFMLPSAGCRPRAQRFGAVTLAEGDGSSAGTGFGAPKQNTAAAEERGRKALEELRAATGELGYDNTLQGLRDKKEDEVPEIDPKELEEFKSQITLGLAGFLIVGGIISLVIGGSIWEPSGANEDGTPPAEQTPAFGFAPKAAESPPPAPP